MSVRIRCNCGYNMELPDEWAGRRGRCPQCARVLDIPAKKPSGSAMTPTPPTPLEQAKSAATDTHAAWRKSHSLSGNSLWLALLCGGAVLLCAGIFIVVKGHNTRGIAAHQDTPGGQRAGKPRVDDEPRPSVFRPTVPDSESRPTRIEATGPGKSDSKEKHVEAPSKSPEVPTAARPEVPETWSLRDFGVTIPPGANMIEVDGVELPVRRPANLSVSNGTTLVLSPGKHVVRFSRSDAPRVVEPKRWFLDAYRELSGQMMNDGRWSFDRLLEASGRTLDRFTEPLVPHFWGNYYWQEGQRDAAARQYQWALQIAPTFVPAYFNLALIEQQRGNPRSARRYLRLASLWNTQNAYGLSLALHGLQTALDSAESGREADEPDWYTAEDVQLESRDRDMIAVMRSAAEFAPRTSDRAKILNNIGAYFEHSGKPELALENYRSAAGVFSTGRLEPEEKLVIAAVLENLARVCRDAGMPEHRRYERLQTIVNQ